MLDIMRRFEVLTQSYGSVVEPCSIEMKEVDTNGIYRIEAKGQEDVNATRGLLSGKLDSIGVAMRIGAYLELADASQSIYLAEVLSGSRSPSLFLSLSFSVSTNRCTPPGTLASQTPCCCNVLPFLSPSLSIDVDNS